MASVSKDLTWKLWDTNSELFSVCCVLILKKKRLGNFCFKVDYVRGQEAKILLTGKLTTAGPSLIALSPDSYSVAVSVSSQLSFYSGLDGECLQTIENVANGILSI